MYREINYLGPCKSFVERSIYYNVPSRRVHYQRFYSIPRSVMVYYRYIEPEVVLLKAI